MKIHYRSKFPETPTFAGGNRDFQHKYFPQYLGTKLTQNHENDLKKIKNQRPP